MCYRSVRGFVDGTNRIGWQQMANTQAQLLNPAMQPASGHIDGSRDTKVASNEDWQELLRRERASQGLRNNYSKVYIFLTIWLALVRTSRRDIYNAVLGEDGKVRSAGVSMLKHFSHLGLLPLGLLTLI